MVANHSGTGTGYGVFTDSYRTGKLSAINYVSTIRYTPKRLDFCAALTKIHQSFLKAIAIPSQCFFTDSNVTCLSYIRRRNCTLTNGYIFINRNIRTFFNVNFSIFFYVNFGIFCNINGSACINIGRSHCRSHACTGHNTCCNQHCQQLFRRAAFTAMIFRDFGDNNVCVARLTPNYFEYFVHIDSFSFLCILAQEIILVCTKHFAAD